MWILGIIVGGLIGGFTLSFFIGVPLRFINSLKENINSHRINRIRSKCFQYTNDQNIGTVGIGQILNELELNDSLKNLTIEGWMKFYEYLYKKYDPQYREDVIDDVLKGN